VHRLVTPLLRRVYLLSGVFIAAYLSFVWVESGSWNKERLYRKLMLGSQEQKLSAAFDLAYVNGEEQLLRALKSPSPSIRTIAGNSLWELWVRAGGHDAFRQVQAANRALERKALPEALHILTDLTRKYPEFPEGWNRRATVYWQMGRYEDSIADARKAIALNPNHFGAWQGMGLCQVHLGNLEEACHCLRAALRIAPHDRILQRLVGRFEEYLRLMSPRERVPYDTV
jgi:tetratricopeptide (TPR) repeat protein